MSLSAKILPFPSRAAEWLSPREADSEAQAYFAVRADERSAADWQRFLRSPDILLSICSQLRRDRDLAPTKVLAEARGIYQWISKPECDLGLFDERDYFLGETALLAGIASRHLGQREEAFLWLDRAEAGFRHTMNPAPGLANVAYARLSLRFEMGRYPDVLELTPSLEMSFVKLRMDTEAVKCRILLAATLKMTGQHAQALELLDKLPESPALRSDPFLHARVLTELGDLYQLQGDSARALGIFQEAASLLREKEVSAAGADLKLCVGAAYKAVGSLESAKEAYRAAQRDYSALQMPVPVAYSHLLIAETLLEMNRDREAEWEILAALPVIDEVKMVQEGLVAVALLRESVRRRRTDPIALQNLRAYLQANG
jgi:tetratricopeptide (TPR) repeat protein